MNILFALLLNFSITAFENNFIHGDIKNLEKYFASERKVYIEFSVPFNINGFFSKSQVLALFREIFLQWETKEFKVVEKMEGNESLILKIEWRIWNKLGEEMKQTSIFMRLSYDKNRWFISEIKGT